MSEHSENGNGHGSWRTWLLGLLSVSMGGVLVALAAQIVINTGRITILEVKVDRLERDEHVHSSEGQYYNNGRQH